jgi:hypothetical protein
MFSTRTTPPDASEAPLKKLNKLVKGAINDILGLKSPPAYVHDIAALSLANGGLGITNLHQIRHTAYFASVAHAVRTWTTHFGDKHPLIIKWTNSESRTSKQFNDSFTQQSALLVKFNTTTIKPAPLNGEANTDKADPEQLLKIPTIPQMPQSTAQTAKLSSPAVSRLQNTLSKIANVVAFRAVWGNIPVNDKKRRTQFLANTATTTNLWLRAIPTSSRLRFTPFEFRLNLLQHFALDDDINALLQLPSGNHALPCACGHKDRRTNTVKTATYTHLLNCMHGGAFLTRHNNIVGICADSVRSVGLVPELECRATKATTTTGTSTHIQQNKLFDVTVAGIADANIVQADITVASHRQRDDAIAMRCARFPLAAANNAVTEKRSHFHNALEDNETLYPLAAETTGALHNNFFQFFSLMATRVNNKQPAEANWATPTFTSYWMTVASATLRRENARALRKLAREARQLAGVAEEVLPAMDAGGQHH